jgi:hypothetical protein
MDEPNAEKDTSLECTSTPDSSWAGASLYKSLKLGWHWRRLRWAVVAASEAAQGHEANGLPPGWREFKTLFDEVVRKVQEYSTDTHRPSFVEGNPIVCHSDPALREKIPRI